MLLSKITISDLASLLDILIGKKYKAIIKKKKNNHGTITLLAKTKLGSVEILISKALIHSYISHDEFFLVNNALKEYI